MSTRMKVLGGFAATCMLVAPAAFAGTIVGSAHDFTDEITAQKELCVYCHTPHSSLASTPGPLWNRASYTPTGFTMYVDSASIDGTISTQPDGTSQLCLSCHDGTVAIDSYGGATGTITIGNAAFTGGPGVYNKDLTNEHPISITYPADGVAAGQEMELTSNTFTYGDGTAGSVGQLLDSNKVQCSSCHDVHNTKTAAGTGTYLLQINNTGVTGSPLCLACHAK